MTRSIRLAAAMPRGRLACPLLALLLLAAPCAARAEDPAGAPSAGAPSADAMHGTADAIAGDLMSNLAAAAEASPGGVLKVAVQPFRADEVPNRDVAEKLNSEVEAALKQRGGARIAVMERAQFAKVWAEASEFQGGEPTDRFRDAMKTAGADVLVFGKLNREANGYSVSYRAVDVRLAGTGTNLAFTREPRLLRATVIARAPLSMSDAIFDAAREVSTQLVRFTNMTRDPDAISHSGDQSDMADLLLNQFENELRAQLPEARRHAGSGAQAFTGEAAAASGPLEIMISASVKERIDAVEVRFEAQAKDRGGRAAYTVYIAKREPAFRGMLPLDPNRRFVASAEAVVKGALDRDAAVRAARALARARVIMQMTDPSVDDTPVMVTGLVDGVTAMQAISGGLTFNEQTSVADSVDNDGTRRVRVTLSANVKALGRNGAPVVRSVISAPSVQSGKPFALTLSADAPAYVAVFAWTSDDLVLRMYPYGRQPPVVLSPGEPLTLPRKGEQPFESELRPGTTADFEGLIVVASSEPIAYDKIAEEPGTTYEESQRRAKAVNTVFETLAKLKDRISVSIVPYQLVSPP